MPILTFKTSDNVILQINSEKLKCSVKLQLLLECGVIENDKVMPICGNSAALKKVVQWAMYHKDNYEPDDDADELVISDWDKQHLTDTLHMMYNVMYIANSFKIQLLVDIIGKLLARIIKEKNSKAILQVVNIKNDLTQKK